MRGRNHRDRRRTGRALLVCAALAIEAVAATVVGRAAVAGPDAIEAVTGTDATAAAHTEVTAPSSPCRSFGFSAPSSWNDPSTDIHRIMNSAATAGARSVRIGIEWDRIETSRGTYDWSSADRMVDAAAANGLQVVALLHTTPTWARDGSVSPTNRHTPPAEVSDYASFAATAARRYAGTVRTWEIWNEPNIADFWFPHADHAAYTRLLTASYAALKAQDPSLTVIGGSMAPSPDTPWSYSPDVFLAALYADGAKGSFDAISQHPYPSDPRRSDEAGTDDPTWAPLRISHQIMQNNGDGHKKVWVTEFGLPTGTSPQSTTPSGQAAWLVDAVRATSARDWVGGLYLYSVRDEGDNPSDREYNYGVYTSSWVPKPAVAALAGVARSADCRG